MDQNVQTSTGSSGTSVQSRGESGAVDGLDEVEEGHRPAGLVGLQVADEVPSGGRVYSGLLGFGLLDLVLAHVPEPCPNGGFHRRRRSRFGDGDDFDLRRYPIGKLGGTGDALLESAPVV